MGSGSMSSTSASDRHSRSGRKALSSLDSARRRCLRRGGHGVSSNQSSATSNSQLGIIATALDAVARLFALAGADRFAVTAARCCARC